MFLLDIESFHSLFLSSNFSSNKVSCSLICAAFLYSLMAIASCLFFFNSVKSFCISSMSLGIDKFAIFTLDEASSKISIALSGKNLSDI